MTSDIILKTLSKLKSNATGYDENNALLPFDWLYVDDTQIYLSFKPENYREAQHSLRCNIEKIYNSAENHQLQMKHI